MKEELIEKAMKQAKTSIEVEGLLIKPEYTKLVRDRLSNKVSEAEFQRLVKKMFER